MAYTPENNPYIPGDPYSYDLKWIVEKLKSIEKAIPGYTSQLKNDSGFITGIEDIKVPLLNRLDNSEPWIDPPTSGINNWFIGGAANLQSYDLFASNGGNHMEFTASAPHTLQLQKLSINEGSVNGGADFSGITDGDTLILSAEFKTSAEMGFRAGFALNDGNASYNFSSAAVIQQDYNTEWKRLTATAVVPTGWIARLNGSLSRLGVTLLLSFTAASQMIQVRRIFFGLGNVATDWQPSPADIIAQA